MTVEADNVVRLSYTGSGTTGPFTTPYFLANADIKAVQVLIADGTETELVLDTDFTLDGAGDEDGGTLTLTDSLSSSYKLVIINNAVDSQLAEYPRNDPFPASTHQAVVDRRTMVSQRHGDLLARAVVQPDGDGDLDMALPPAVERASKYMAFNASGEPIASDPLDGVVTDADQVQFLQAGTGAISRTIQAKARDIVCVLDFRNTDLTQVAGNGTQDDGSGQQAAIDAVYAAGGGLVYYPRSTGDYKTGQSITLKYKVGLLGAGNKDSNAVQISALSSLDGPVLVNDETNGPSAGTGIDGDTQRLNASSVRNIAISNLNTTSMDNDAVRFKNAWTITLENCRFTSYSGFALRLLDCNVIHLLNSFVAGCVFGESLADSIFIGNQMGPTDYPSVDNELQSCILWLSGAGAWKNLIQGNMIYNGPNGVAKTATTSNGSDTLTVTGHGYSEGTPVTYSSTGTFGLSGDATYYVHVLNANSVKLATSRANLTAGTYATAGAASGTETLRVGLRACLAINDGANKNVIGLNRIDQGYHEGVRIHGSNLNTLIGNSVFENGRANATAGISGVRISNADDNSLIGNLVDGTDTVTSTGTSNQDYGFTIGSTCDRTKLSGNTIVNHATLNVNDASTSTIYDVDTVFIHAHDFDVRQGTPALTFLSGSRRKAWALDGSADEAVTAYFRLPNGAPKWEISAYCANLSGAGTGNVVTSVQLEEFADGDDISANEGTTIAGTFAIPAQDLLKIHTYSTKYTAEGLTIGSVTFKRSGADGNDTHDARDMGFIGLAFKPTFQ